MGSVYRLTLRQLSGKWRLSIMAVLASLPVIIAGDTNLPVLSPLFRANLGRYQDGFSSVIRPMKLHLR